MGKFGGFYKGEKKKKKKTSEKGFSGSDISAPIFTLPKIVSKKKKQE